MAEAKAKGLVAFAFGWHGDGRAEHLTWLRDENIYLVQSFITSLVKGQSPPEAFVHAKESLIDAIERREERKREAAAQEQLA